MTDFKPEAGKPAMTRDRRKAHVVAIRDDVETSHPVMGFIEGRHGPWGWTLSGRSNTHQETNFDLISEWKEPRSGEVWVNLYGDDKPSVHATEDDAKDAEKSFACRGRTVIARLGPIPWTEGQGLTEENGNV